MEAVKVYSKDESDALAWRHLMRSAEQNTDDALMAAWELWRERECVASRANRSVDVDAGVSR